MQSAKDKHGEDEFNAKLFIGNLDQEVDEKTLYDTFAQFGAVLSAKVNHCAASTFTQLQHALVLSVTQRLGS